MLMVVTIHVQLGRLMGERGLKVAEVAASTGLTYATINSLYKGEARRIDLKTLNRLCAVLDVTPGDLLSYSPGQQPGDDDPNW